MAAAGRLWVFVWVGMVVDIGIVMPVMPVMCFSGEDEDIDEDEESVWVRTWLGIVAACAANKRVNKERNELKKNMAGGKEDVKGRRGRERDELRMG